MNKQNKITFIISAILTVACGPVQDLSTNMTGYTCDNGKTPAEIIGVTLDGKIKNTRPWNKDLFCKMAKNVSVEAKIIAAEAMDSLCSNVMEQARKSGSVDILMKTLEGLADIDESSKSTYKLLGICMNSEKIRTEVAEMSEKIKVEIHSVGTFRVDGNLCPAYLTKTTSLDTDGESVGYTLVGLGNCDGMKTSNAITYHPAFNPHGPLPGEFFSKTLEYDGDVPTTWKYNGKTFKMFPN